MTSEVRRILATPAQLAAEHADASRVADAAVAAWREVDAALSPIIGHQGMAALYKRSLHLACPLHPCLAVVHEQTLQPGDFAPLRAALAQRSGAQAAAAHGVLLQTCRDILTRLIGASLTERLLRSSGAIASISHPAQDTSP